MSVPVNCQRDFNLLSFDPDGDMVRCRYAVPTDECDTSSNLPNDFSLRGDCTLSFWSNSNTTGTYAVQMMMEDFPTQSISLPPMHLGSLYRDFKRYTQQTACSVCSE
ncbi:hypothetical protein J4Q44_G00130070, partial [Coregonus suidteri]